jgi:isopenicillin N synthase-like dioxygenase
MLHRRRYATHRNGSPPMTLQTVPVIDLTPYRTGTGKMDVARAVDRACRDIGFLVISGHGVPPELIERTRAAGRAFFDLPLAEKRRVARPAPTVARGYIGLEEESVGRSRDPNATAGDLNESLMIGPVDDPGAELAAKAAPHFAPNLWPEEPASLRPAWTEYYRTMGDLARTLMRIFALALGRDEYFFDPLVDRHISRLRVRNYPAPVTPPLPGQIRAGAHSDYGSLTILCTEDRAGGLQVFNAAGAWTDVPILPDTFIVNIGDLMARWTNDEWVSTLHRVVNPPADAGPASRRQSLVFFHNPNYDAPIESLVPGQAKYPPTTSGAHLARLFAATQNPAAAKG